MDHHSLKDLSTSNSIKYHIDFISTYDTFILDIFKALNETIN